MFTLCDFGVPIKHGFLNIFPFKADMNWFHLSIFYSILTFLDFYLTTNFDSHCHHYYDYFHYYCCSYLSLSLPLLFLQFLILLTFISLVFIILFYLSIYLIFLNFKHMMLPNIVQTLQ